MTVQDGTRDGRPSRPGRDDSDEVTRPLPRQPAAPAARHGGAAAGRWRRQDLLVLLAWCLPPAALALALQGYFFGTAPPTLVVVINAGNVECVARAGFSALTSWCHQTGAPLGAPVLLGLPQTYLAGWISLLPGIDAAAALKVVGALCTLAGYAGTVAVLRRWGAPVWIASLGAFLFQSSPTMLAMTGFGYTFTGFALMPLYLWMLLISLDLFESGRRWPAVVIAVLTPWLAVFTDGYSFVAAGLLIAGVGIGWLFSKRPGGRTKLIAVGAWGAGIVTAVGAYTLYVPSGGTDLRVGIGAFRYLGLDAITLVVPPPSVWWSSDAPWRSMFLKLWGDGSNSTTNYLGFAAIALAVVAIVLGALRRRTAFGPEALAVAVIGVIALVLSFGPALKVANYKVPVSPSWDVPLSQTRLWLPTEFLYEHAPGFDAMRATYRSFAVTRFALVMIACLGLSVLWRRRERLWRLLVPVFAAVLVLEASPNVFATIKERHGFDQQVADLQNGFVADMQAMIRPGEKVLILPASNDFLATASVPFTGGTSYNVGGDKNYYLSSAAWPAEIKAAVAAYGKPTFADLACGLFAADKVDVIVLSYWNLHGRGAPDAKTGAALKQRADAVAATGRFDVVKAQTGLAIRADAGC